MKIPYAEPGSSRRSKTGWSINIPAIDKGRCIGCGLCVQHCPEGCIELIEKKAVVDFDYCKGCGICATLCPAKAIEMKKREGRRNETRE